MSPECPRAESVPERGGGGVRGSVRRGVFGALRAPGSGVQKVPRECPESVLDTLPCPSFPCFFWNSLFFFPSKDFLVFLNVFPFFSRDFRGSVGIKNPCFFGGFPCLFQKNKERKDRVLTLQEHSRDTSLTLGRSGLEGPQRHPVGHSLEHPSFSGDALGDTPGARRARREGERDRGRDGERERGREGERERGREGEKERRREGPERLLWQAGGSQGVCGESCQISNGDARFWCTQVERVL